MKKYIYISKYEQGDIRSLFDTEAYGTTICSSLKSAMRHQKFESTYYGKSGDVFQVTVTKLKRKEK
jgi:hypothetical protein